MKKHDTIGVAAGTKHNSVGGGTSTHSLDLRTCPRVHVRCSDRNFAWWKNHKTFETSKISRLTCPKNQNQCQNRSNFPPQNAILPLRNLLLPPTSAYSSRRKLRAASNLDVVGARWVQCCRVDTQGVVWAQDSNGARHAFPACVILTETVGSAIVAVQSFAVGCGCTVGRVQA